MKIFPLAEESEQRDDGIAPFNIVWSKPKNVKFGKCPISLGIVKVNKISPE
jgi:hypothetical protein